MTQLLVGYFLDANPSEGKSSEEQAALNQQMEDAMHLLPKLSTGIDVNVRFNSPSGFEVGCLVVHAQAERSHALDP